MTVTLRAMSVDDMPAVMALEEKLFPEDAWSPAMFASEVAESTDRRLYLVAETGGQLIGYAWHAVHRRPGGRRADLGG